MPAPDRAWWSSDYALYTYLYEPLSKYLCWMSPNAITVGSFLMTFPILQNLLDGGSVWALLGMVFVRQSLDCLDGSVARSCRKQSQLGAYLDIWSDVAALALFFTVITNQLFQAERWLAAGVSGGVGLYLFITMTNMGIKEHTGVRKEKPYSNALDKFLNNNTVVLMLVVAFGASRMMIK